MEHTTGGITLDTHSQTVDSIAGELLMSLINDMELLLTFEQRQRVTHFQNGGPEANLPPHLNAEYRHRLARLARLVEDKNFLRMLIFELGAMERPDLQDYLRSVFGYKHELQLQPGGLSESDEALKEYVTGRHRNTVRENPDAAADTPETLAEIEIYRRRNKQMADLIKRQQNAVQQTAEMSAAMLSLFVNYLNDRVNNLPPEARAPNYKNLEIRLGELEAAALQMARKLKAIEQNAGKPCGYAEVLESITSLFQSK
jgi:hypothetical protein